MPTLTGYVDVWGKHGGAPIDHAGPASYTTGGQTLTASKYGLRSLDYVGGGLSISGTYEAKGKAVKRGLSTTYKLVWYVVATGAEVTAATNLSAETVRLLAIGG